MNANGGGLVTPKGAPVRRPPDPGWSPLVHAGEPRKVCHEAGEGSATRLPPIIVKTAASGPLVSRLFQLQRKLTAADFDEDSDEDFWDEVDAEWACDICNDDGGGEEQGGDVEQDGDGARDGQGPGGFAGGECAAGKESDAAPPHHIARGGPDYHMHNRYGTICAVTYTISEIIYDTVICYVSYTMICTTSYAQ